jgi:AmmeMemoRadiSam system protein B
MQLKSRPPKAAGYWYPHQRSAYQFKDNPVSSCVISPHAGFRYSGRVSLEAVSYVKKNRVWFFGTSHQEGIENGMSVYYGSYSSSIGRTRFPETGDGINRISTYFSDRGHRTDEHSIENVLYCLNHFAPEVAAFCTYIQAEDEDTFERVSDDIAKLWQPGDSIIVSTDWIHYVSTNMVGKLMKEVTKLLEKGEIRELYYQCRKGELEACGIDGVYMAYKVLSKVGENTKFIVLEATDSSRTERNVYPDTCVGYIAARN